MTGTSGSTHAFVLHRREHGNTSLLLDVFAAGMGRFPAIARGARRPRVSGGALLQPFQPLWLTTVGRGEVRTLTRFEATGRPLPLAGRALLCGFYLNELLVRLLGRDDPHDDLFVFYQDALGRLGAGADLESVLRRFELRLLAELGYGVALDVDGESGEPVVDDRDYVLEIERGLRRAGDEAADSVVSGATLLRLARGDELEPGQRREARLLVRRMLEPYLGERPLRSRELFRAWYGEAPRLSSTED